MQKAGLFLLFIGFMALFSCGSQNAATNISTIEQSALTNSKIMDYKFLDCMYADPYFPPFLVDKCKAILLKLCNDIEKQKPADLNALYALTQAATDEINKLEDEFEENGSEIETAARECLASNFEHIAQAYGFDADTETLISTRNW